MGFCSTDIENNKAQVLMCLDSIVHLMVDDTFILEPIPAVSLYTKKKRKQSIPDTYFWAVWCGKWGKRKMLLHWKKDENIGILGLWWLPYCYNVHLQQVAEKRWNGYIWCHQCQGRNSLWQIETNPVPPTPMLLMVWFEGVLRKASRFMCNKLFRYATGSWDGQNFGLLKENITK